MSPPSFGGVAWIDVEEMTRLVRGIEDAEITLDRAQTRLVRLMRRFDIDVYGH